MDDKNKTPGIPEEQTEQIIKAAVRIGRTDNLLFRKVAQPAAEALFFDPAKAEGVAQAAHDKAIQEALTAAIAAENADPEAIAAALEPIIKERLQQLRDALDIVAKGKAPSRLTKNQRQTVTEAAAFISGTAADALEVKEAVAIIREVLDSMSRKQLNDLLRQEGLKPIAGEISEAAAGIAKVAAENPEADPNEVLRKCRAADVFTMAKAQQINGEDDDAEPAEEPAAQEETTDKEKARREVAEQVIDVATLQALLEFAAEAGKAVNEFRNSPTVKKIHEATEEVRQRLKDINELMTMPINLKYFSTDEWHKVRATLAEIAAAAPAILEFADELTALEPYLTEELKKPEYDGKSIDDLFVEAEIDDDGRPAAGSLFAQALEAARTAASKEKQLPQIKYNTSTELKTVTDKFANVFLSLSAPRPKGEINGQRQFTWLSYEKQGAKKEISLGYDYNFNYAYLSRFGIQDRFDDQSFFVAAVIDNLLDEGNDIVSLTKIWHESGNAGSPNSRALTELLNILRLGMSTIITADVSEVAEAWAIELPNQTKKQLETPVIPVQFINEQYIANGNTASAVVKITGHTPFFLIGHAINHYTTWNKDILRLYKGKRTKRYFTVLRFLITQIGWMRNSHSKRSNKILYSSLYEYNGDKTTRAQQLSRDMMYRLLDDVFIPLEYVTAYKEDATGEPGVMLTYKKQPKITKKK